MKYIKTFENQKGRSFMDWLLQKYPVRNEWKNITEIICSHENLVNLDGIENLVNLKFLYCDNNQLTELNLENLDNLKVLDCCSNQLTELNIVNLVNLKLLDCSINLLTKLNIENLDNLKYLSCYHNRLTELKVENLVNLIELKCSHNQLTELNIENLNLKLLICSKNNLPYDNWFEYEKWFEQTYPEKIAAKRYNL